jgi:hypothetical protein
MSAEIIPFDRSAPRRLPMSAEAAWEELDTAQRVLVALLHRPDTTMQERLAANLRAYRANKAFIAAMDALS